MTPWPAVTAGPRSAAKWGFGMAPPLPGGQARRRMAVPAVLAFLDDPLLVRADLPDALPEVKGLYTRCWRQD